MICVGVLFLMCFRYGFDVILFWSSKWFREFRESRKVNCIKIIWYHPIQIVFKRINIISTTYVSQGLEDCGFDVEAIGPKDSPRSPAESGTQGSVWNSVGLLIVLQNGECWCSICWLCFHGNLGVTVSRVNPSKKNWLKKHSKNPQDPLRELGIRS